MKNKKQIKQILKKSQIWSLDLIAGVTVFLIVMTIYFAYTNNILNSADKDYKEIYNEAAIVSETLISSGVPSGWEYNNVEEVGLTDGKYRLNVSKISNMSVMDYSVLKTHLKTKYDYLIFFEDKENNVIGFNGISYIGKSGVTKENIKSVENPEIIIPIKRFVFYNSSIISMVIYVWQ